jgi:hypothetical protein
VTAAQLLAGLMLPLWTASGAWVQPSAEDIVLRMTQATAENRTRLRAFEVVRSYKLFGKERLKAKSEVTARITYIPPDIQHYTIHKANGLGIGEAIVRKILESENEVLIHQGASDISPANYAFRFIREDTLDEQDCYLLELHPLRKDSKLIRGTVWINTTNYLIVRIEGSPAQGPSWWVHNIRLALDFNLVDGMWLQTGLVSTGDVRLLGQHTLVSRDVEYNLSHLDAAARSSYSAPRSYDGRLE